MPGMQRHTARTEHALASLQVPADTNSADTLGTGPATYKRPRESMTACNVSLPGALARCGRDRQGNAHGRRGFTRCVGEIQAHGVGARGRRRDSRRAAAGDRERHPARSLAKLHISLGQRHWRGSGVAPRQHDLGSIQRGCQSGGCARSVIVYRHRLGGHSGHVARRVLDLEDKGLGTVGGRGGIQGDDRLGEVGTGNGVVVVTGLGGGRKRSTEARTNSTPAMPE